MKSSTKTKARSTKSSYKRGGFALIAKLTGYDISHVRKVMLGESNNPSGEIKRVAKANRVKI